MKINKVPAVVLAGSRLGAEDPVAQLANLPHKVLFPVKGKPMVERVIEALLSSPKISEVWVCIEDKSYLDHLKDKVKFLTVAPTLQETVALALNSVKTPCLITTGDHALLQTQWIAEFLDKVENSNADVMAAVALKERVEADVPNTSRTYLPLSDRRFSGCNLFFFSSPRSLKLVELWGSVQKFRKNPIKMAKALGGRIVLKAAVGRVTSAEALERIYKITDARLELIEMSDGRMAVDIDKVSDVKTVDEILQNDVELI